MTTGDLKLDTFPKLLLHHSGARGERPAIREKSRGIWRTVTWRELAEEAAALAAALSARGLQRGAHVALLGDNRPRLYAAMCAAHWLGAIVVPLYQDATADEIASSIAERERHPRRCREPGAGRQAARDIAALPDGPMHRLRQGPRHAPLRQRELVSYDSLLQQGRQLAAEKRDFLQAEIARGSGEDSAFLFFTSGTTGPAKGVVLTHASLIDRARVAASMGAERYRRRHGLSSAWVDRPEPLRLRAADGRRLLRLLPRILRDHARRHARDGSDLFPGDTAGARGAAHAGVAAHRGCGWVQSAPLSALHGGGAAGRCANLSGEHLSIGDRLASIASDLLICGPLRDVLGMSKVRVAYTAGDAIAPDLLMFFRALGINLKQLYGSTETGFFVAMQRDGEVKPDTVGPPVDGVELKFTPQREILVRSPGLFKEYHGERRATAQARNADGWFHTGDAGYLGDDGHLRIIDRMADVGALNDGTPFAPKLLENKLKFVP